jgi:translation elongation factor EF-Tu-like GTPase
MTLTMISIDDVTAMTTQTCSVLGVVKDGSLNTSGWHSVLMLGTVNDLKTVSTHLRMTRIG